MALDVNRIMSTDVDAVTCRASARQAHCTADVCTDDRLPKGPRHLRVHSQSQEEWVENEGTCCRQTHCHSPAANSRHSTR